MTQDGQQNRLDQIEAIRLLSSLQQQSNTQATGFGKRSPQSHFATRRASTKPQNFQSLLSQLLSV